MLLSVIIPSFKDPLLENTIKDILRNAQVDLEVIPVIDGYECPIDFSFDKRVKPIYLKDNYGMRTAINVGVTAASGDYLMRSDEHCAYAFGFAKTILEVIDFNFIVAPVRYDLNIDTWQREGDPRVYEKLIIGKAKGYGRKFAAHHWPEREAERVEYDVDETMAMQGSCWFMSKKHWHNVIKRLDLAYGPLYQDSTEMIFKTWQAGGKMMVNKTTWYAHRHRRFGRTFKYSRDESIKSFTYALNVWEDYYKKTIKPKWKV